MTDLDVPTLVLTGARDVATPPSASHHIADLIPGARVEIYEGAGHHPWIEEPERFSASIRRFLADLDSNIGGDDAVQ